MRMHNDSILKDQNDFGIWVGEQRRKTYQKITKPKRIGYIWNIHFRMDSSIVQMILSDLKVYQKYEITHQI